jgi:hypothetical protein
MTLIYLANFVKVHRVDLLQDVVFDLFFKCILVLDSLNLFQQVLVSHSD